MPQEEEEVHHQEEEEVHRQEVGEEEEVQLQVEEEEQEVPFQVEGEEEEGVVDLLLLVEVVEREVQVHSLPVEGEEVQQQNPPHRFVFVEQEFGRIPPR